MEQIRAIIFDLGGVVVDMESFLLKLVDILKPNNKDQFWQELNLEVLPLSKGQMTAQQFCRRVVRKYNKESKFKDLLTTWIHEYEKLVSIDQEVMQALSVLREKYKVALLSNTNNEHIRIIRKWGVLKAFDVVILSTEVKMTKDEKEIFLLAAKKLGVKPDECLFIDDVEKFVRVAKSVGMKAILYKNPAQLKEELRSFSVKLD